MDLYVQMTNTEMNGTVYDAINEKIADSNVSRPYGNSSYHPITTFIEVYTIPVICLFGILGNTLSSVVFLQKPLRNSSCSIFLAARGFSDNGFLATLLIIWISRTFQLQLGTVSGSCRIIIFFSYVCGCISVWLVVLVTIENYIRICKPMLVNKICKTTIAEISVIVLCCFTICVYTFPFWAMSSQCVPYDHFYKTVQAFVYIDTLLTLVVPLICLIFLMSAILCELIKSFSRRKRLYAPTAHRVQNPLATVTKMLLAVTVTFFCLNLPSHVNRLLNMISSFVNQHRVVSLQEEAIQQITLLVYYLSLSINIIVYLLFGHRFRNVLRQLCCTDSNLEVTGSKETEMTVLETVHMIRDKEAKLQASNRVIRKDNSTLLTNDTCSGAAEQLNGETLPLYPKSQSL